MQATAAQLATCERFGVEPIPATPGSKVGVAANVKAGPEPLNGLRHLPAADTSGWYIWRGEELSSDPDFFAPLHVDHVEEWAPGVMAYLALPPGWRFLIAEDYEDVWFDASLLDT